MKNSIKLFALLLATGFITMTVSCKKEEMCQVLEPVIITDTLFVDTCFQDCPPEFGYCERIGTNDVIVFIDNYQEQSFAVVVYDHQTDSYYPINQVYVLGNYQYFTTLDFNSNNLDGFWQNGTFYDPIPMNETTRFALVSADGSLIDVFTIPCL